MHPPACTCSTKLEREGRRFVVRNSAIRVRPIISGPRSAVTSTAPGGSLRSAVKARHLVGERNRHQHARFASQHLFEPRTLCCAAFARLLYDSTAADDEEAPERALAHFGRCAKLL